jgi:hypothetical protein
MHIRIIQAQTPTFKNFVKVSLPTLSLYGFEICLSLRQKKTNKPTNQNNKLFQLLMGTR